MNNLKENEFTNNANIFDRLKSNLFICIFIITTVRLIWNFVYGFRWPSAYVLTNNVFTYDFGFIPRGLVASLLKILFGDRIYSFKFLYILIIGTALLILLFFVYLSYYFNLKEKNLIGSILILWYSLSIYSAYLSHEAGYFEQYGYLMICILTVFSSKIKSGIRFASICSILGFISLLISETNAFLVYSVLFVMGLMRILIERSANNSMRIYRDEKIRKKSIRDWIIYILMNLLSLLYCGKVGLVLVSKTQILRQLELIRSHSDKFERLDEIGGYFYSGSRMPDSYITKIEFKVWNWQLKCYMLLIIFVTAMILITLKQYQKTFYYISACVMLMICIYCLNFIAWDTERFKFGVAMAITFFSLWVMKETDIKELVLKKDIIYTLIVGTMLMFMIMDFRLGLFDGAVYNNSWTQLNETLKSTWRIN